MNDGVRSVYYYTIASVKYSSYLLPPSLLADSLECG
ncbi:hypothetical protein B6N60_03109 [Richelia sinica FACHB-800]|uniref:Uncharacterized protein n=1 Tax=Richelia sinica FACHB-800 TaxID=1357546 RepID=A0A975Y5N6_9NOST|nr:hypothetical protein B6N60_03109 [Richelia sinica FACHB-800]